jgi:hypothetical protein
MRSVCAQIVMDDDTDEDYMEALAADVEFDE